MKLIHITAESEIYSVNEIVEEPKAVNRLIRIRQMFMKINQQFGARFPDAKLIVKTCVHNPELFS